MFFTNKRSDLQLVAFGALLEIALFLYCMYSDIWRGSWRVIGGFFLPGMLYLWIAWRIMHSPLSSNTLRTRVIIFCFAALFHLTFLFSQNHLSNDLYRYYWDGKLLSSGVNPYTYPPDAVELIAFRDEYWGLIFNRDVPTGYPPLAEGLFAVAYWIAPNPWVLQLFAVLASLGTVVLLMSVLRCLGMDERRSLLYGWSPLVALEFANSAHLDVYALLFMCAALLFMLKHKKTPSAIGLALGGLIKLYPVLLMPLWVSHWRKKDWLAFFLVFGLPWLLLLPGGTPFKGLWTFANHGDFNSSLYGLIQYVVDLVSKSENTQFYVRGAIFIFLAVFSLVVWMRQRKCTEIIVGWKAAGTIFGVFLIFSPIVQPWYVIWMVVFTVIEGYFSWLVLSVTVIFARHIYINYEQIGVLEESWWVSLVVWTPFFVTHMLQWVWIKHNQRFSLHKKR